MGIFSLGLNFADDGLICIAGHFRKVNDVASFWSSPPVGIAAGVVDDWCRADPTADRSMVRPDQSIEPGN
jgi:hypothetical protein